MKADDAEDFTDQEIHEQDGWICQICTEPVDPNAQWPDQMMATVDHIIPFIEGGRHTRSNVQCSHLHCNLVKGRRRIIAA